jgi:hypothetical protein
MSASPDTLGLCVLVWWQVPFVGFNVVKQAECAASHGLFILVQVQRYTDIDDI